MEKTGCDDKNFSKKSKNRIKFGSFLDIFSRFQKTHFYLHHNCKIELCLLLNMVRIIQNNQNAFWKHLET